MRLSSILLFSENPKALQEFYKKVFNKDFDYQNGDYADFNTGGAYFEIGPHDKVHGKSQNPERILFNFHVDDVKGEFERIKKLGVKVIREVYVPKEDERLEIATFEDPDGNYFQIMTDWTKLPAPEK